ncbi:hypothetical protein EMIHUDRAFT_222509 [Emiliania huxleyi CCMP1516]|uniref:Rieske domain-containing protein n=2 Tax=Emiliania huxleyi TaxID=2903 RepID=A0A0D3KYA8_EMIH1|nr:hypothetical protein EMIHUDRAFT_222509 [Emiliania huxleyi CCMP1516]EOD40743.1 hypothetical protein EMIHUDRAFT_222509 [Emiliania huxleyi CCMP1516]|eukprot:XP_005793172.1 hypothetical protein EMIHUDRAFT_222509 [Emiliania huxleyi CCMP1516]
MPSPDAAARHTGDGVARRQAHHERMRDERAREAAAGDAELPPEDDAVEMASAVHVLDSVAEVGPNYTLLRSKETKAKRRKRKREDARAALDGHTVLSTGSRLEIFCDSERWYPATYTCRHTGSVWVPTESQEWEFEASKIVPPGVSASRIPKPSSKVPSAKDRRRFQGRLSVMRLACR